MRAAPYIVPLVVVLLGGLPAIRGGFLRDDVSYVMLNPQVTEPAPLGEIFRTPFPPESDLGLYRPLTTLSLRADFVLGHWLAGNGFEPLPYHLTNFLLAAAAGTILVLLARRLGLPPRAALLAGALFAAHAARSEAVDWISGRAENLMTLGVLASLLAGAGPPGRARTAIAAAAALAGVLGKEQAIVAVPLLLLLPGVPWRTRLRRSAAAALALGLGVLLRARALGALGPEGLQQVFGDFGVVDRTLLALAALGDYVGLLLWPRILLNEYDVPATLPPALNIAAGGVVLAAALATAGPRTPRLRLAMALVLLPLVPVLNVLYRTGEPFAERFLALPAAGFAVLGGLVAARHRWAAVAIAALVFLHVGRSHLRAREFVDEETLLEAQLRDAPDFGSSWFVRGRLRAIRQEQEPPADEADLAAAARGVVADYERACELAPESAVYHLELARYRMGMAPADLTAKSPEALAEIEAGLIRARDLDPRLSEACVLLSRVAFARSDAAGGTAALHAALERNPHDMPALGRLAEIAAERRRPEERRQWVTRLEAAAGEALVRKPDSVRAHLQLASALGLAGRGPEAISLLRAAAGRTAQAMTFAETVLQLRDFAQTLGRSAEAGAAIDDGVATLRTRLGETRPRSEICAAIAELERARGRAAERRRWLEEAERFAPTEIDRRRLQHLLAVAR